MAGVETPPAYLQNASHGAQLFRNAMNGFLGLLTDPVSSDRVGGEPNLPVTAYAEPDGVGQSRIAAAYGQAIKPPGKMTPASPWNVWAGVYGGFNRIQGDVSLGATTLHGSDAGPLARTIAFRQTRLLALPQAAREPAGHWHRARAAGAERCSSQASMAGHMPGPHIFRRALPLLNIGCRRIARSLAPIPRRISWARASRRVSRAGTGLKPPWAV